MMNKQLTIIALLAILILPFQTTPAQNEEEEMIAVGNTKLGTKVLDDLIGLCYSDYSELSEEQWYKTFSSALINYYDANNGGTFPISDEEMTILVEDKYNIPKAYEENYYKIIQGLHDLEIISKKLSCSVKTLDMTCSGFIKCGINRYNAYEAYTLCDYKAKAKVEEAWVKLQQSLVGFCIACLDFEYRDGGTMKSIDVATVMANTEGCHEDLWEYWSSFKALPAEDLIPTFNETLAYVTQKNMNDDSETYNEEIDVKKMKSEINEASKSVSADFKAFSTLVGEHLSTEMLIEMISTMKR